MRQVRNLLLVWLCALPAWTQTLQATLEPDGDVTTNWTCTGGDCGSGHYAAVNDDDTADYVHDSSTSTVDRWTTVDNTFAGTINYVRLRVHGMKGAGGAGGTCRVHDGSNFCGTVAIPNGGAWATNTVDYTLDCGGGAWEDSELDALDIECTNGANKQILIAWADAEIWGEVVAAGQPTIIRWHSVPFGPGRVGR